MTDDRCIDGRLWRHEPQPDDPHYERDVGPCPERDTCDCRKVEVIARVMSITGKGEPMSYWKREAGVLLSSLKERRA